MVYWASIFPRREEGVTEDYGGLFEGLLDMTGLGRQGKLEIGRGRDGRKKTSKHRGLVSRISIEDQYRGPLTWMKRVKREQRNIIIKGLIIINTNHTADVFLRYSSAIIHSARVFRWPTLPPPHIFSYSTSYAFMCSRVVHQPTKTPVLQGTALHQNENSKRNGFLGTFVLGNGDNFQKLSTASSGVFSRRYKTLAANQRVVHWSVIRLPSVSSPVIPRTEGDLSVYCYACCVFIYD